jgi:hypothetical protein
MIAAMTTRKTDISVPAAELAFAIAAFGCGLFDAPIWLTGAVALAMMAHWGWTRRKILRRLPAKAWAMQTSLAICVLIAIQAGAYWLGLGVRGFD